MPSPRTVGPTVAARSPSAPPRSPAATPTRAPGSGCATTTPWCSPVPRWPTWWAWRRGRSWPSAGTRDAAGLGPGAGAGRRAPRRSSSPSSATAPAPRAPRSSPTPIRPPTPAPTRCRPSTPTTRSRSWPTTPAAPAPAGAGNPAGVVAGSGVARRPSRDPLVGTSQWRGQRRRATCTCSSAQAALDPGAGADYVDYDFAPADPMGHAEDSTVSDRPLHHPLLRPLDARRAAPSAPGPDILDRHRNLFGVGYCVRSEDTFSAGDGGYATNIDGPVRVDPLVPGREQRHVHAAGAPLLPGGRTGADVPPRARHPRDHRLLRLQRRRRSACATRARPRRRGHRSTACPTRCRTAAPTWEAVAGAQGTLVTVDHACRPSIPGCHDAGLLHRRQHAARRSSARATRSSTAPAAPPSRARPIPNTDPAHRRPGGHAHRHPVERLRAAPASPRACRLPGRTTWPTRSRRTVAPFVPGA